MATLFISDLHLDKAPSHHGVSRLFFQFLTEVAPKADALYILGDLFEVWIGDDTQDIYHHKVINALKALTEKGLPIYIMHGNRDFLIGSRFCEQTSCQLLKDPSSVSLYGKKILLMHGDSLCTKDSKYQAFRKKVRSPRFAHYFLMIPFWIRRLLANRMRKRSQQYSQAKPSVLMDVHKPSVDEAMLHFQVDTLIHGHIHHKQEHHFNLQDKPSHRYVLNDWHHERGNVLIYTAKHKVILEDFYSLNTIKEHLNEI